MSCDATLVLDARAKLGEGAIWDSTRGVLYWVDIDGGLVHVYAPATNSDRAIDVGQPVGTVVQRKSGGLVLALKTGFHHLDLETEKLAFLCDPEGHDPDLRFNDGKCDPAGRFWAGTMASHGKPRTASLYCLFPDLTARRMLGEVTISNGICWSLDARTMYYIDTPTQRVDAFDYDAATGESANRRPVVVVPAAMGHPDGMTIDAEGMLWVAHWGGSAVCRWDPASGRLIRLIPIPASRTSSCAFGGPDLDELYVTSARVGLSAETLRSEPHAGGLFKVEPGVCGVPAFEFAG